MPSLAPAHPLAAFLAVSQRTSVLLLLAACQLKMRKPMQAIARGKWAGPGGPRGGETIGQVPIAASLHSYIANACTSVMNACYFRPF